jgi:subtilisin family serine protease
VDPALQELVEQGAPEDEVPVLLRLRDPDAPPSGARIVSRFGDVATVRVRRGAIPEVWADDTTLSVKAPYHYRPDLEVGAGEAEPEAPADERRPADLTATGRGVVVGLVDWGCDFAHPDLRRADGRTRLLALWDQRPAATGLAQPYGYGRILGPGQINDALTQTDPYAALGYHPGDFDAGLGAHGTHTTSIAVGNGRGGGPLGMAPEADCVFVNMGKQEGTAGAPLGSSVELLEALHFIVGTAGDRPCVINLSLGRHAGEHTGRTLVERAMDQLLAAGPGRSIVQSCGNYCDRRTHSSWRLRPGEVRRFRVEVDAEDRTTNELDLWYPGRDRLRIELRSTDGVLHTSVPRGERASVTADGREVARVYHRAFDPNNGDHQCLIYFRPDPSGPSWEVTLVAEDVVDGRVHAWIERDSGCRTCQSRFPDNEADPATTIGTIANGYRTVAVGAYDAHRPDRPIARFSSSGPTRDGRQKPDLVAPGVMVLGARSTPRDATPGPRYVRMSGTSMAAPAVTGTVALMFEAAGRPLGIEETRSALLSSCAPPDDGTDTRRLGSGHLDLEQAVAAVIEPNASAGDPDPADKPVESLYSQPEEGAMTAETAVPAAGAFSVAELFDAYAGDAADLAAALHEAFAVVGKPEQALRVPIRPGDLLIARARGIPFASLSVLAGTELRSHHQFAGARWALQPGYYVTVFDGTPHRRRGPAARRITDLQGVVPAHTLILRPRAPAEFTDGDAGEAVTCTPAPEPDPTGRGPHRLVSRGSKRPAVGHAQLCLNNWIAAQQAGTEVCANQPFVTSALATLASRGQLPLNVDCDFGSNTELAAKAFQTCRGVAVDGKIGPVTWPLLDAFAVAPPLPQPQPQPPATMTGVRLLVDADRTGELLPAPATWQFGPAGSGGVVLVNNDDDGVRHIPDNENDVIDTGNDPSELAPLAVDIVGTPAPGTQVELSVDHPRRVRIFESRAVGARELIGPTRGDRHTFHPTAPGRIDLAMEAIGYPARGFDGQVTITLGITDPATGTSTSSSTVVRIAPWIIPHHLDRAERVYVADAGGLNPKLQADLPPLVAAAGCALVCPQIGHGDVWVQDCMEFGFSSNGGATLRTVLRAVNPRHLDTMARSLLDADIGYVEPGPLVPYSTYNSTGNLDATPPVTSAAGKRFPHGRIYFSHGTPLEPFDPAVLDFLRSQVVQDPIELDLTWLTVGHVDEVISFVAAPNDKGFVLLLASPRVGYQLLDAAHRANPTTPMLRGRRMLVDPNYSEPRFSVEQTVAQFLALRDDFHPGRVPYPTHVARPLRQYNQDRQADIDATRARLLPELGLTDAHVVDIPAVFMPNPLTPTRADAFLGAMVNMLVLNGHCVVPKPFGPEVGGIDLFEKDVRDKLQPLGAAVSFIDCWDEYHVHSGGVHCATNTLRSPSNPRWWDFQP